METDDKQQQQQHHITQRQTMQNSLVSEEGNFPNPESVIHRFGSTQPLTPVDPGSSNPFSGYLTRTQSDTVQSSQNELSHLRPSGGPPPGVRPVLGARQMFGGGPRGDTTAPRGQFPTTGSFAGPQPSAAAGVKTPAAFFTSAESGFQAPSGGSIRPVGQPSGFGHGFGAVFQSKALTGPSGAPAGPSDADANLQISPGGFFKNAKMTGVAKRKDSSQSAETKKQSASGRKKAIGQSWAAIVAQSSGQQQPGQHCDDLSRHTGPQSVTTRELVSYRDVAAPAGQTTDGAGTDRGPKIKRDPVPKSASDLSPGDIPQIDKLTAIVVKEIPSHLCDRQHMVRHFSRFGKVLKTYVRHEKNYAYITFEKPEEAQKAKKNGRVLERNSQPVQIFLKSLSSRRSTSEKRQSPRSEHAASQRVIAASLPLKMKHQTTAVRERRQALTQTHSEPLAQTGLAGRDSSNLPAAEIIRILEERDKIMQQAMAQKSDLRSAKATVGSCCDMCPDLERYIRQERRYLSPFEVLAGTENMNPPQVDHTKAVKEYNRSAADKKDPLPHELRPPHVLDMTMDYMMNNILDVGDGRWAEWFDFVWNRTRGIRKDITQQHLYDITSTHLIEKCTRFHIHCAHSLSECDMATFDPKINTENMTKCVQSLKHFYYDLGTEGRYSEFEAEFRAYEVLLNLNENDILREVQQLRPVVRDSHEMKFALKCFFAVNSNNYVHFFKLVKSATYLSACLLHRYFLQVRETALQILNRSYSIGRAPVPYPLSDLMRILAFENLSEAAEMCQHYGIAVHDDQVQFCRQISVEPEARMELKRAPQLIHSKIKCSVGEVVNGGPLPANVIHVPSLKLNTQLPTVSGELKKTSTESQIHIKHPDVTPTDPVYQGKINRVTLQYNEDVKDVAKGLINSSLRELLIEISEDEISRQLSEEGVAHDIFNSLCSDLGPQLIREVANQIMEGEMAVLLKQRREMAQASIKSQLNDEISQKLLRGLLYEVTTAGLHEVASHAIVDTKSKMAAQRTERMKSAVADEICDSVLDAVVVKETRLAVKQVHKHAVAERDERLETIRADVERNRIKRIFLRWRKLQQHRRHMTQSMQTFPPCDTTKSHLQRVTELCSKRRLDQHTVRTCMGLATTHCVIRNQLLTNLELYNIQQTQKKQRTLAWRPFDLPSAIGEHWRPSADPGGPRRTKKFWKLISSFSEASVSSVQYRWLKSKLSLGQTPSADPVGVLEDDKAQLWSLYSFNVSRTVKIHVCNKAITGYIDGELNELRHHLLGTTGIIFTVDFTAAVNEHDRVFWSECRDRYRQLMTTLPSVPRVAVIILVFHNKVKPTPSIQTLTHKLQLDTYTFSTRLFKCLNIDAIGEKSEKILQESVEFCLKNFPVVPRIRSKDLTTFLEENLAERYFYPVRGNMKLLKEADLPHQRPHNLVLFYNETIASLKSVATNRRLTEVSWPVLEFTLAPGHLPCDKDWNTDKYLQNLEDVYDDLTLPEFPDDLSGGVDWDEAVAMTMAYVSSVDPSQSALTLVSRISDILERLKMNYEGECYRKDSVNGCIPAVEHIPWTYIIEACVDHKMSLMSLDDGLVSLPTIHYIEETLECLNLPAMWHKVETQSMTDIQTYRGLLSQLTHGEVDYRRWVRDEEVRDTLLRERDETVAESGQFTRLQSDSRLTMLAEETSYLLQDEIKQEKENCDEFEVKLNHWLSGGYSDTTPNATIDPRGEAQGGALSFEDKLVLLQRSLEQEKRNDVIEKCRIEALMALL